MLKKVRRLPFNLACENLNKAGLANDKLSIYGIDPYSWDAMPLEIILDLSQIDERIYLKGTGFFLMDFHIKHCFSSKSYPINLKDQSNNFTVKGKK